MIIEEPPGVLQARIGVDQFITAPGGAPGGSLIFTGQGVSNPTKRSGVPLAPTFPPERPYFSRSDPATWLTTAYDLRAAVSILERNARLGGVTWAAAFLGDLNITLDKMIHRGAQTMEETPATPLRPTNAQEPLIRFRELFTLARFTDNTQPVIPKRLDFNKPGIKYHE